MRVICVEDHPIQLAGLMKYLQKLIPNAEINGFTKTTEAFLYAKQNVCDILITEIEFLGQKSNGVMLAHKVKKLNQKVNIIFTTVCDANEYASEVLELRASGYITKPVTEENLKNELEYLRFPVQEPYNKTDKAMQDTLK